MWFRVWTSGFGGPGWDTCSENVTKQNIPKPEALEALVSWAGGRKEALDPAPPNLGMNSLTPDPKSVEYPTRSLRRQCGKEGAP